VTRRTRGEERPDFSSAVESESRPPYTSSLEKPPIRKEPPMERTWYRIAVLALLSIILAVAAPTAWAQPVNFEEETHFRCYIVSEQTPQPAVEVTLEDQFQTATLTVTVICVRRTARDGDSKAVTDV
jgi:hypothetical protein